MITMSGVGENFIAEIVCILPELENVLKSHMEDYEELLLYVFMGEVTEYVIENISTLICDGRIDDLLGKFEHECLNRDEFVGNLISLGFFENLIGEDSVNRLIHPKLGPCLKAQNSAMLAALTPRFDDGVQ